MKFVKLPSGTVVNMGMVTHIFKNEDGTLEVYFAVSPRGKGMAFIELKGEDADTMEAYLNF